MAPGVGEALALVRRILLGLSPANPVGDVDGSELEPLDPGSGKGKTGAQGGGAVAALDGEALGGAVLVDYQRGDFGGTATEGGHGGVAPTPLGGTKGVEQGDNGVVLGDGAGFGFVATLEVGELIEVAR